MNRTHPIEAGAIGAVALVRLARAVLVPCVALVLVLAGYRPAAVAPAAPAAVAPAAPAVVAPAAQPAPVALAAVAAPAAPAPVAAAPLTVVELRRLARAAGFRALARNGRRADLLAALALA